MLFATCDRFTEGFDTPDLRETRALIEELSSGNRVNNSHSRLLSAQ